MRKTKIVATIGPASESEEMLLKLIDAGMNVVRMNFSHGSHEEHLKKIERIKKINKEHKTDVAIMLDTKGPEIRLGEFRDGEVSLVEGEYITLTTDECEGTKDLVHVTYKNIINDVKPGTHVLLNDGLIDLVVERIIKNDVICKILNSASIKSRRGVNIPGVKLSLPALTEQDKADIKFGVENDVDYIAASFVRKAADVKEIKEYLRSLGGEKIKVISKIENQEGIENFDEILVESDGIMVARGDMGVEMPLETIPENQKVMIKKAYRAGKPVITATQMLESMIHNPRPTRAEVSDVANAIYDSSSAIMLSGETAMGDYPVECIKMMDDIATTIESSIKYWNRFKKRNIEMFTPYIEAEDKLLPGEDELTHYKRKVNFSVCSSAMFSGAKAVILVSENGKTPSILSGFRPACPIFVITASEKTYRQFSLEWGVYAIHVPDVYDFDEIISKGINILKEEGKLSSGDTIVISGGYNREVNTENYLSNQALGAIIRI